MKWLKRMIFEVLRNGIRLDYINGRLEELEDHTKTMQKEINELQIDVKESKRNKPL